MVFQDGQKLKTIYLMNEEEIQVGKCRVISITVVMQLGQRGSVPWFLVTFEGHLSSEMYNAALTVGVELFNSDGN